MATLMLSQDQQKSVFNSNVEGHRMQSMSFVQQNPETEISEPSCTYSGFPSADSTAELCALNVLDVATEEDNSNKYHLSSCLGKSSVERSSSVIYEPEISVSHEALRSKLYQPGYGLASSFNNLDEDDGYGLLDLESETYFDSEFGGRNNEIIMRQIDDQFAGEPTAPPSCISDGMSKFVRSRSDAVLSQLSRLSLEEPVPARSVSSDDMQLLMQTKKPLVHSNLTPDCRSSVCSNLGLGSVTQLREQQTQIRRVTSQPVFPSYTLTPVLDGRMLKSGSSAALAKVGGPYLVKHTHNHDSGHFIEIPHASVHNSSYPAIRTTTLCKELDMMPKTVPLHPIIFAPAPTHQPFHMHKQPQLHGIPVNLMNVEGDGFLYQVQFKRGIRSFLLSPNLHSTEVKTGSYVKVEADRGEDLGKVVSKIPRPIFSPVGQKQSEMHCEKERIVRLATEAELRMIKAKAIDEHRVLEVCRLKVKQRNLPMQVIDAEFQFDRHKLTFFFKAEGRIDFRELVRDLFALYKTRIWMQQVEVNLSLASSF